MSRLMRLYPAAWRERYEAEFLALLHERRATFVDLLDIVRGALDARIHPQVRATVASLPPPDASIDDLRVARRLGIGAMIGAATWLAAWFVASIGPVRYDDAGAYRDGASALPLLLVAVALLAGGLIGQMIRLPRSARLARGSAGVAMLFVLIWATAPWLWPLFLVVLAALVGLAVGAGRAGAWPTRAILLVVGTCIGVAMIATVAAATSAGDRMAGGAFFALCAVVLVPVWIAIGATLIRLPVAGRLPA